LKNFLFLYLEYRYYPRVLIVRTTIKRIDFHELFPLAVKLEYILKTEYTKARIAI
jgi:hypothetical protein